MEQQQSTGLTPKAEATRQRILDAALTLFAAKGYEATTGIGPDLMAGARAAVLGMIDLLSRRYNMAPVDAYMLCSVCADLRISEIVDVPNWVVSFYFPRVVLE